MGALAIPAGTRAAGPVARPRPASWARIVGLVGLVVSLSVAGYYGWQLWGTGLITDRAQDRLRQEMAQRMAGPMAVPPEGRTVQPGHAVAILRIPKIGLDMVVVEGTGPDDLQKGPGHYDGTAFPWEGRGRVAVAGHRTTYARPFWSLDRLGRGDLVVLETEFGTFRYRVTGTAEVEPSETWVLRQTRRPTLVLTTCTPRFSADRRLVVFAVRR